MKTVVYFDTNALLNLYSTSINCAEEVIECLKSNVQGFIYVVSDITKGEFLNKYHACRKVHDSNNKIGNIAKTLKSKRQTIVSNLDFVINNDLLNGFKTNIIKDAKLAKESLNKYFDLIDNDLTEIKKQCERKDDNADDTILNFVNSLNTIKWDENRKENVSKIIDERFDKKIGPGLTDVKQRSLKCPYAKYGDQFIWQDILNNDYQADKIIFIEDEKKIDWWDKINPSMLNDSLFKEFKTRNPQTIIEMLHMADFMKFYFSDILTNDTLGELTKLTQKLNDAIELETYNDQIKNYFRSYTKDIFNHFLIHEEFEYGRILEILESNIINLDLYNDNKIKIYDQDEKDLTYQNIIAITASLKVRFLDKNNKELINKFDFVIFFDFDSNFYVDLVHDLDIRLINVIESFNSLCCLS